ncbi:carboxylesterase [Geomicrobium sp. JCM 19038]|uniref:alpha/beta hydrolase n=1 Tax=Geomicrobium sp. JCM 19038 TaxID=1460635 RepID=UPI0005A6942F|nr:alpha/beta fold hydrolase [Geomicrobium sp. JCM 19038]
MIGCLCLHGFTGSPEELQPLTERLQRKKGWLVYTPVLPGHGVGEDIGEAEGAKWIYTADRAAKEMLKHVDELYVIGFSMGGMLACYLAAKYPVKKLVLLNAAAYYVNRPQMVQDLVASYRGSENPWLDLVIDKRKETPMTAFYQFIKTIRLMRPFVEGVTSPVMIGQGMKDILVPEKSATYLFEQIGSKNKTLRMYEHSNHFLCHDVEQELVIRDVEHFLKG